MNLEDIVFRLTADPSQLDQVVAKEEAQAQARFDRLEQQLSKGLSRVNFKMLEDAQKGFDSFIQRFKSQTTHPIFSAFMGDPKDQAFSRQMGEWERAVTESADRTARASVQATVSARRKGIQQEMAENQREDAVSRIVGARMMENTRTAARQAAESASNRQRVLGGLAAQRSQEERDPRNRLYDEHGSYTRDVGNWRFGRETWDERRSRVMGSLGAQRLRMTGASSRLDALLAEQHERVAAASQGSDGGGPPWNWRASMLGGIGGRMVGGHLGGIGGMLGGGLGGPAGAVAGALTGAVLEVPFKAGEAAVHLYVAALKHAAHAVAHLTEESIKLGAEYEKTLVTYDTLTKGSGGKELAESVRRQSYSSPYTTEGLLGGGKELLEFGVDANQVVPILSRLGDIAAGDEKKFDALRLSFGRMLETGRVNLQQLRPFTSAGVGIEEFAKTAGMTSGAYRVEMGSTGRPVNDVIETINRLTAEGRFAGLAGRQSQTASGAWQSFLNRATGAGQDIGMDILGRFGVAGKINSAGGDDLFTTLRSKAKDFLDTVQPGVERLWDTLTSKATGANWAASWESVKKTASSLIDMLPNLINGFEHLTKTTAMWAETLSGSKLAGLLARGGEQWAGGVEIITRRLTGNEYPTAGMSGYDKYYFTKQMIGMGADGMAAAAPNDPRTAARAAQWRKSRMDRLEEWRKEQGISLTNPNWEEQSRQHFAAKNAAAYAADPKRQIALYPTLDPDAAHVMEQWMRAIRDGVTPLEKFSKTMQDLETAKKGVWRGSGLNMWWEGMPADQVARAQDEERLKMRHSLGIVSPFEKLDRFYRDIGNNKDLTPQERADATYHAQTQMFKELGVATPLRDFREAFWAADKGGRGAAGDAAKLAAFRRLQQGIGVPNEMQLPGAQLFGGAEAAATVWRSADSSGTLGDILATLKAAEERAKGVAADAARCADALEALKLLPVMTKQP